MTTSETPHGRSRYRRGCRCDACREANREYQRQHRAKRAKRLHAVPDLPAAPASKPSGSVVEAVQRQLEGLPTAVERPALAAIAVALAEGLDKPSAQPHHAALARVLVETLGKLARGTQRRGRLAAVQRMTNTSAN